MARLLVPAAIATALLTSCVPPPPSVTCTFEFPAADTPRVAADAGFNIFIEVTGDFTVEELPRVDFFSDVEVGSAFYDGLFPADAGMGKIMEGAIQFDAATGCTAGCLAGARIDTALTPGNHTITAKALSAAAQVACEINTSVVINAPPSVETVTILPGDADATSNLTVAATTGDPNGDPVTVSYRWTGPDGTEGNFPRGSIVHGNFFRYLGIHEKQSSCLFQAKSAETTVTNNLCFDVPRAGFNLNE